MDSDSGDERMELRHRLTGSLAAAVCMGLLAGCGSTVTNVLAGKSPAVALTDGIAALSSHPYTASFAFHEQLDGSQAKVMTNGSAAQAPSTSISFAGSEISAGPSDIEIHYVLTETIDTTPTAPQVTPVHGIIRMVGQNLYLSTDGGSTWTSGSLSSLSTQLPSVGGITTAAPFIVGVLGSIVQEHLVRAGTANVAGTHDEHYTLQIDTALLNAIVGQLEQVPLPSGSSLNGIQALLGNSSNIVSVGHGRFDGYLDEATGLPMEFTGSLPFRIDFSALSSILQSYGVTPSESGILGVSLGFDWQVTKYAPQPVIQAPHHSTPLTAQDVQQSGIGQLGL